MNNDPKLTKKNPMNTTITKFMFPNPADSMFAIVLLHLMYGLVLTDKHAEFLPPTTELAKAVRALRMYGWAITYEKKLITVDFGRHDWITGYWISESATREAWKVVPPRWMETALAAECERLEALGEKADLPEKELPNANLPALKKVVRK